MDRNKCRAHIALSASKSKKGHMAYIAPSRPMAYIVQQVTSGWKQR